MALFTLLLDYDGGTYVTQVAAVNEHEAYKIWLNKLSSEQVAGAVSAEIAAGAAQEREYLPPQLIALDGLKGVWCESITAGRKLALINIVRTEA